MGGPLHIHPNSGAHPWAWTNPRPSQPIQAFESSYGLLFVDYQAATLIDARNGKSLWTAPVPILNSAVSILMQGAYVGPSHVTFVRQVRDRNWYEEILVWDKESGQSLARVTVPDIAGPVEIRPGEIRMLTGHSILRFDLRGNKLPSVPADYRTGFRWQNGWVSYKDYEDFPMDYGDQAGLRGIELIGDRDLWDGKFMRRVGKHGGIIDLNGKEDAQFFGPPICADADGLWTERTIGGKTQLIRLGAAGEIQKTNYQPYVDYPVQWTDRGIWFRQGDSIFQTNGTTLSRVMKMPGYGPYQAIQLSRSGLIRLDHLSKGNENYTTARFDPWPSAPQIKQ